MSQPPPPPQPPQGGHLAHSLAQSSQGSSSSGWRSEEDYFLGRLAVRLGYLDPKGVQAALARQGQLLGAGQALSLGQLLVREGGLPPQALIHLQHELSRCHQPCPACGAGNWHAPGPQPRHEQCRHCGAPLPVAAAGSSLTGSFVANRLSAVDHGTQRFHHDPLQTGVEGPRLFANYILDQQIAKGGMGAIYRVRHAETGATFALKVLLAADKASDGQVHRFKREAKAQIELGDHPNIVKIHEAGEWEGILYYAMDLIEGTDLGATTAALSRNERVKCMATLGRAVHYAHEQGYLHRDLKPANVLLDKSHQPLITDFGLAKNLGGNTMLTQEGAAMGTPFYMAPEQAVGKLEDMGPCSDVYSLGVILYELICGEVPFRADSTVELYRMILELAPAPFAAHDVMEPDLELVAFKAMEKEPEHRYATALAFAEDLELVLAGEKPSASSVTSAARLSRKVEENKRSIGFILASVVASLVVLIVVAFGAKFALRSYRKGQAATQREEAARSASAALARSVDLLETSKPNEALAGLDEALDLAAEAALGNGIPPRTLPALQEAWRPALLARVRVAILYGEGREGRRAAACLAALTGAGELSEEEGLRAATLQVRVHWRLGETAKAEALLAEEPLQTSADPLVKALRVDALLREGRAVEALAIAKALGALDPDRFRLARCLLAAGKLSEAQAEVKKLFGRGSSFRGPWTRELLLQGELPAAFQSACDHVIETASPAAGRQAAALGAALGRDHEALLALERALKRAAGESTLSALRLRLQARLGEDISKSLKDAADHPELRLLRADWAAKSSSSTAKTSTDDPILAAAAAARDPEAPIGEAARGLLDDLAHDRPPNPLLGRGLRDLSRALAARGEAGPAQKAAKGAWRSLQDLDSALIGLGVAEPKSQAAWVARVQSATLTELSNLQGPLARGLLCARWPRAFGAEPTASAAALKEAKTLLSVRQLAGPNLVATHYLARATQPPGAQIEPALPAGVDWEFLIPALPLRASVSAEDQAAAAKAARIAADMPRAKNRESELACQEILAKDPWNYVAQWQLGTRRARFEGPGGSAGHLYMRRLRLRPGRALSNFWFYRGDWLRGFMATSSVPGKTVRGVRDGTIPSTNVTKVDCTATEALVYTYAETYPRDVKPVWPKGPAPPGVRAMIGDAIRRDPLYLGLLYLEAFHFGREGLGPAAVRNLSLLERLVMSSLKNRLEQPLPYEHVIFRAWIRSAFDPNAGQLLVGLKLEPVDKDFKILLAEWISEHAPDTLRRHPGWTAFARKARTE